MLSGGHAATAATAAARFSRSRSVGRPAGAARTELMYILYTVGVSRNVLTLHTPPRQQLLVMSEGKERKEGGREGRLR